MELMDFGVPPSMDSDKVWSDATNSTAWKLPSFTVSTLRERGNERDTDYGDSFIMASLTVPQDLSPCVRRYL